MLVGMCAPFASKVCHQKDVSRSVEEDAINVEITIENACQQVYIGTAVVACVTIDKEKGNKHEID